MSSREAVIDGVKYIIWESETNEPPQISLGTLEDLIYNPSESTAAIFSCITDTKGEEIIRKEKPFLGFYIDDAEFVHYEIFDKAIGFIDRHIKNGDVKIVCEEGKSRSVAISLAYYMSKGMSLEDAGKKLGRHQPACGIHALSLINYAREKGWMNEEDYTKEKIKMGL